MIAWLDLHPPVRAQFNHGRREPFCGVVGAHTSEGVKDDVGPDTGTDVLAGFIQHRPDPGSYHDTWDSDSALQLVDDGDEAYSIAVDGWNRASWNGSFVCRTTDLHPADGWTVAAMRVAGPRVAQLWQRTGFCVEHSARWLTRSEALALRSGAQWCPHGLRLGGLSCHGTLQPADRSDAWSRHPFRVELEAMFVAAILGTTTEAPQEEKLMFVSQIATDASTGQLWHVWGFAGQMPYDCGYIRDGNEVATLTSLYGATPIQGDQSALVSLLLEQTQKHRPGEGEGLTLADLQAQSADIKAGVQFILDSAGRPDAKAFAEETVDALVARLAS